MSSGADPIPSYRSVPLPSSAGADRAIADPPAGSLLPTIRALTDSIQLHVDLLGDPEVLADQQRWWASAATVRAQAEQIADRLADATAPPADPRSIPRQLDASSLSALAELCSLGRPVSVSVESAAENVEVDGARLEFVLGELARNTYGSAPAGAGIQIEGSLDGNPPQLVVRFWPAGPPPGGASSGVAPGSLGLPAGLAVAQRLAESGGGTLSVDRGATPSFRLALPIRTGTVSPAHTPPESSRRVAAAEAQALSAIRDVRTLRIDAKRRIAESSARSEQLDEQTLLFARDVSQLQALRRTYEHLVPTALLNSGSGEYPPVEREATILFSDIRGFTGLAERYIDDAPGLLAIVNEHLAGIIRAIARCGGVVEKFVGDGILATFGARDEQPDHRDRALAAALAAVVANEQLNRRRSKHWGFRLEVGIGAATGRVVVGRLGSRERWEFGVLGDPVNVASRLVAQAAPGEVLLEERAFLGLSGTVRADVVGDLAVRGRVAGLRVYRLGLSRRGGVTRKASAGGSA